MVLVTCWVIFLPSLLCGSFFLPCQAQVYYVTPTPPPSSACSSVNQTGALCQTLDYYANSSEVLFDGRETVSIIFLKNTEVNGTEQTTNESVCPSSMIIRSVTNLTLAGVDNDAQVSINCSLFLSFIAVSNLEIKLLQFQASFSMYQVTSTLLYSVNVYGMSVSDDFSSVEVIDSELSEFISITGNVVSDTRGISSINFIDSCVSPGGLLAFNFSISAAMCEVKFQNVSLMNVDLSVIAWQGYNSSGVLVLSLTECSFRDLPLSAITLEISTNVAVHDCSFENLQTPVEIIYSGYTYVTVKSTVFENSSLAVYPNQLQSGNSQKVELSNVTFKGQTFSRSRPEALFLYGPTTLALNDSSFDSNFGLVSPVMFIYVVVSFIGNVTFVNNTGTSGGAIHMRNSTLLLNSKARVSFVSNFASQFGGAISIDETVTVDTMLFDSPFRRTCFYQLNFDPSQQEEWPVVYFENNLARIAGDDIFGAGLNSSCTVTPSRNVISNDIQASIFEFQNNKTLSSISSLPKRVCICNDNVPRCDKIVHEIDSYPGQLFDINVATVGSDFGMIFGGVLPTSLKNTVSLRNPKPQDTIGNCTRVTYSFSLRVFSAADFTDSAMFILSTDITTSLAQATYLTLPQNSNRRNSNCMESGINCLLRSSEEYLRTGLIEDRLLYSPLIVSATILPCPLGLEYDYSSGVCECIYKLMNFVNDCSSNGLVRRGTVWIGSDSQSNILAYHLCPFEYCIISPISVNLTQPDSQCALSRSGILCGGCPPGLSLAIGSSKCLDCPDNGTIAYFLLFVVAGIVLIFVVKILDLTVANGTINGFILFANILWINQDIFFPKENSTRLKFFIAWLNLDFGIETCFIKGLDAYWKTWLQFVFPFYLWSIAGLIAFVCHYSSRATKFFGNNAVPVLTTVFLLTYSKFLRILVLVFGGASLEVFSSDTSTSSVRVVWLLDGNVQYFGLQHSFLFIAGLLFLVFLCLPYTVILLLVRQLSKSPIRVVSRLMIKFRPLLDSYIGPFKNNHQYWIGLTLLARVFLAISAVSFQAVNSNITITLVGLVSAILCILVVPVYTKIYLSLLEVSLLFNVVILCFVYLSTGDLETRIICTAVSTGFCLLLLLVVVCYRLVLPLWNRCVKKQRNNYASLNSAESSLPVINANDSEFVTKTDIELRESFLENTM